MEVVSLERTPEPFPLSDCSTVLADYGARNNAHRARVRRPGSRVRVGRHKRRAGAAEPGARSRLNAVLFVGMFVGMAAGAALGSVLLARWEDRDNAPLVRYECFVDAVLVVEGGEATR